MFVTAKDCQKLGNDLCMYLNNIPMSAIQNGRRYFYDTARGILYANPNGEVRLVKPNKKDWLSTYAELKATDTSVELLYSLVS